jgi:hypothetical protein
MKTYRVMWEIDIDAQTPREAAEKAREIQIDLGSEAIIFIIIDEENNEHYVIDLLADATEL